ncbi:hypothetical protein [Massilia sp. 9096]|uniref:hypothetical protein n=1 Tax=Massilia sp. 9096 TaxID=1500894 RepID=UPI000A69D52A|nr:hypothetical protein [Massilia sp. 9096]
MSKQKGPDSVRARGIAKEKIVPVAEGSLQPRAPGWVAPGGANVQSANIEQQGAALRARGSLQGGGGGSEQNVGSQRGGAGAQQAGWSARQSGQRVQARGEEDRLNAPRQSGYGGMEQKQVAGSQESVTGPQSSQQSGKGGSRQYDQKQEPASDYASKPSKKGSFGSGQ